MNKTPTTLRKPDANDIESLRSLIEEVAGRNLPPNDVNQMLAAGLRALLKPDEGAKYIEDTTAPSADLVRHHFTLPEYLGNGQLRSVVRAGQPWFVAADVCAVLGLSNTTMALSRLDEDEQTLISIEGIRTGPGNPNVYVINESGLFSLILTSRKPQAKPFKRWVTHEVLPSIARTGGFQDDDGAMDGLLRAATDGQLGTAQSALQQADLFDNSVQPQPFSELALMRQLHATQQRLVQLLEEQIKGKKRNPVRPLTVDEIKLARNLKAQGASQASIARHMGRSQATISLIVRDLEGAAA